MVPKWARTEIKERLKRFFGLTPDTEIWYTTSNLDKPVTSATNNTTEFIYTPIPLTDEEEKTMTTKKKDLHKFTALVQLNITVDVDIMARNMDEALAKARKLKMNEIDLTFPWNDGEMYLEGVLAQDRQVEQIG